MVNLYSGLVNSELMEEEYIIHNGSSNQIRFTKLYYYSRYYWGGIIGGFRVGNRLTKLD